MALADQLMPMLSLGLGATGQPAPVQQIGATGMGTPTQQGQLAQYMDPQAVGQLAQDQADYQRRSALAQQLMQTQYVPNSGRFGFLADLATKLGGGFLQQQQQGKLSDLVARQAQQEAAAAQAKRIQDLQDLQNKTNIETGGKIQEDIAKAKAEKDYQKAIVQDGMVISDPNNPATSTMAIPGYAAQQIGIKTAEANAQAAATASHAGAADAAKLGMINKLMQAPQSPQRDAMLASLVPAEAFQTITGGATSKDMAAINKRVPVLQDQVGKIDTALQVAQDMKAKLATNQYPTNTASRLYNSWAPQAAQTTGSQEMNTDTNSLVLAAQSALQGTGSRGSVAQLKILQQSKPGVANTPEANANAIDHIIQTLEKARQSPAAELDHYGSGGTPRSWAQISSKEAAQQPATAPSGSIPSPPDIGSIPAGAIQRLKANPGEAALFDQQFGNGASSSVLGLTSG